MFNGQAALRRRPGAAEWAQAREWQRAEVIQHKHHRTAPLALNLHGGAQRAPCARAGHFGQGAHLLQDVGWLHVVAEAADGETALTMIGEPRPDIAFLGIQWPGLLGTQVLRRLTHRPQAIFTTAHAEYAVTAFEWGALDYLLKPFGAECLQAALQRLQAALGEPAPPAFERLADAWGRGPISRLFVRQGRAIVPIAVEPVQWFEAVADYVALHADSAAPVLHMALVRLEQRLDAQHFVRVHRAHIVNLAKVVVFVRQTSGAVEAQMRSGAQLAVSRARAQELRGWVR